MYRGLNGCDGLTDGLRDGLTDRLMDAFPRTSLLCVLISFCCFKTTPTPEKMGVQHNKCIFLDLTPKKQYTQLLLRAASSERVLGELRPLLNHCSHELVGGGQPLVGNPPHYLSSARSQMSHGIAFAARVPIVQRWLSCYPPPVIQFRGFNYRLQILTKGDPIPGSFLSVYIYAASLS